MNTVKNGKGSKSRIGDYKRYVDNYLEINWKNQKNEHNIQTEEKIQQTTEKGEMSER